VITRQRLLLEFPPELADIIRWVTISSGAHYNNKHLLLLQVELQRAEIRRKV
jgi:hypothetical protein